MERAIGDRSGRRVAAGCAVVVAASLVLACGDSSGPDDRAFDLDLAVGDTAVIQTGGDIVRVGFPAASQEREYRVAVQSAARTLGRTSMRLRVTNGGSSGSSRISAARRGDLDVAELSPEQRGLLWRTRLQVNAKQLLQRRGIRPARAGTGDDGGLEIRRRSMLPSDSVPREGDRVQFWFAVDADAGTTCDTAEGDTVTADVVAVGNRVAFAEDTAVDDGASLDMNYDSLARAFDEDVFGANVQYFGSPTDIDGNQKVYVLITPEVNRLSDPDGETTIAGFFNPIDLADSEATNDQKDGEDATTAGQQDGVCEASNEAEVLYLLAPDPTGEFGQTVEVAEAKRVALGTSAHEFQHLLNAANRVIKASGGTFNDLEQTWLDEGLSHLAEEIVGLSATGEQLRTNLQLGDVAGGEQTEPFNAFHVSNFDNLYRYLAAPDTTRAIAASDPQGVASLRMRGFGWSFLRWLADQEHPNSTGTVPNDAETGFFRDLAKAGGGDLSTGITNVEQAAGQSWEELLDDYGLMPAAEDDVTGAPQSTQTLSWDLRDVFRGLHENINPGGNPDDPFAEAYPLGFHENDFSPETVDFEVQGSTQKYFRFASSGSTPRLTLELTNQSGQALSASSNVRILVIRAR